jgi:D-xylulose reductase
MVLGHESAGIIRAVGSAVTTVAEGDRIALEPGVPCRYCDYCKAGTYNLCISMRFAATPPHDGTLTDIYCLPEDFCHKLPVSISLEEGAMIEPLSVAVHIMSKQASVKIGDNVIVFGAGPIGLLCCAVATAYGANKVVAVDVNTARLEFARGYSTTDVFDSSANKKSAEETANQILKDSGIPLTGADIVIDASGAEVCIQTGIHAARPGGTFVQGGMGIDEVAFPIAAMCAKELNVKGCFRYGPGDYKTAINLVANGRVSVSMLVTKRVLFKDAEEAFIEMLAGRGIKTVISGPSFGN